MVQERLRAHLSWGRVEFLGVLDGTDWLRSQESNLFEGLPIPRDGPTAHTRKSERWTRR